MDDNNNTVNKNENKENEGDNTMDIININEEIQKNENETKIDNKENKETKIEIEDTKMPTKKPKKERDPFKLEGAKLPLSIYTRRTFDISLLKNYLNSDSSSGICGSVNLGNTCFMNSSIACISNCTELTYFFLSGQYKKEINEYSKYGLKGKLAQSWYDLLYKYWVENNDSGNPKDFKYIIGEKDARFRGYSQQDSNEFINIFLDTLNEDLNFSDEKKYIELNEKNSEETDEQCAKKFWEANLIRNDSVITDLFCGLFKSTITCPKCNWISVTFEPFYSINLPLKENKKKKKSEDKIKENIEEYKVFYIPKYGIRNTYCANFHNISNITQVKECKEKIKNNENFPMKEILNNVCYFKVFKKQNEGEIEEDDFIDENSSIFLQEIVNISELNEIKIPIFLIYLTSENKIELSDYPRIIFCERNNTLSDFRKKIYLLARKYIFSPFINFEKEKIDDLSKQIENYINDPSIDDDYIFKLIEEEYNNIFKENYSEDEILRLHDYMNDLPFNLRLRELLGTKIVDIFENDSMNELSNEFKKLTKANDIFDSINDILIELEDYVLTVEFNYNSKYINRQNYQFNNYVSIDIESPKKEEEKKEEIKEEKKEEEIYHKPNLVECIKYFCEEEQLKVGNEWYCNKCKEHLLAKKKLDLYYLPKILIINFKRFIKESSRWEKNDENIDFPINNFDMKDLMIGPDKDHSIYDLFAVSQHYGSTEGGHYTAVCKNSGKWYNYDDSSVTVTSPWACLSSAAYVLFYRRQTD